jgi:hypothetical protein
LAGFRGRFLYVFRNKAIVNKTHLRKESHSNARSSHKRYAILYFKDSLTSYRIALGSVSEHANDICAG